MDREYFRKFASTGIMLGLLALSYFLLKPILLAILVALILAFLLHPLYEKINKSLKSKNLSAFLVSLILATIILVPIWFLTPILLKQSFEFFLHEF